MLTSLSEDCAVCGKSFKRLGAHHVRSLACGSYYMPRHADTDECCGNACSNVLEGADHGTRPNLRSSSYSTLFRGQRATVRGEALDDPPIINVNGVEDEDFVVIDEDDAFPNNYADEEDVPTGASEGEEGPNAGVLDLYLKLFQLQDNPLGLAHFSREEEVLIELLQLLKELHCPLNAFEIILKWAAKSNGSGHTFRKGCQPTRSKVIANLYKRYNMHGLIPKEKKLYLPYVISSQVASAHAQGCRWEIGWSTIVHKGAHARIPENNMIHSAMAFGVRSVSNVGRWVMRTVLNGCFPFDKPLVSIPLQSMTGKSANETI